VLQGNARGSPSLFSWGSPSLIWKTIFFFNRFNGPTTGSLPTGLEINFSNRFSFTFHGLILSLPLPLAVSLSRRLSPSPSSLSGHRGSPSLSAKYRRLPLSPSLSLTLVTVGTPGIAVALSKISSSPSLAVSLPRHCRDTGELPSSLSGFTGERCRRNGTLSTVVWRYNYFSPFFFLLN
jgi:hypothetical protein